MSDYDMRRLDRLARSDDSDTEAKARMLRLKLRSGLIAHERLVMAARLGDEASRLAVPEWVEDGGEIDWTVVAPWLSDGERIMDRMQEAINALSVGSTYIKSLCNTVSFVADCSEYVVFHVLPFSGIDDIVKEMLVDAFDAVRIWISDPSESNEEICFEFSYRIRAYVDSTNLIDGRVARIFSLLSGLIHSHDFNVVSLSAAHCCYLISQIVDYFRTNQVTNVMNAQRVNLISYLLNEKEATGIRRNNSRIRRNSDRDILALERLVADNPDDHDAVMRLVAAKKRVGIEIDTPLYAKLILAKIHFNEMSLDRVRMASRLGHAAARLAIPTPISKHIDITFGGGWDSEHRISFYVQPLDKLEAVSFACDCIDRVIPIFEKMVPGETSARNSINKVRAWVMSPSFVNAEIAYDSINNDTDGLCRYVYVSTAANRVIDACRCIALAPHDYNYPKLYTDVAGAIYSSSVARTNSINSERRWQIERFCQYLLNEIQLPKGSDQ